MLFGQIKKNTQVDPYNFDQQFDKISEKHKEPYVLDPSYFGKKISIPCLCVSFPQQKSDKKIFSDKKLISKKFKDLLIVDC